MKNSYQLIDINNLVEMFANFIAGVTLIFPMILSALIAVFIRNCFEWFKDVKKSKRAKKLLILEVKDNVKHLENSLLTLNVLNEDLKVNEISEDAFRDFKVQKSDDYLVLKEMMSEADRHLNLMSNMVYKEIYLKLNRNFNSNEDEILHSIYFHILKIENYKSFLNSVDDKDSKRFFEVYFKIAELAKMVLDLSNSKKINKLINSKTTISNLINSKDAYRNETK